MICHTHKFIFFHNPKTGGSSVHRALEAHCKENNCKLDVAFDRVTEKECNSYGVNKVFIGVQKRHLLMNERKKLIPTDVWDNYFKFAFVRNPYDKLVSEFFFNRLNMKRPDYNKDPDPYKEFDERMMKIKTPPLQVNFIGEPDFIGRFESIRDNFKEICDTIGIPQLDLPHAVSSKHEHYSKYFTKKGLKNATAACKPDLDRFGYSFEKA